MVLCSLLCYEKEHKEPDIQKNEARVKKFLKKGESGKLKSFMNDGYRSFELQKNRE